MFPVSDLSECQRGNIPICMGKKPYFVLYKKPKKHSWHSVINNFDLYIKLQNQSSLVKGLQTHIQDFSRHSEWALEFALKE
jgi:hypothetical protein